jgi:hypothetical protein
VKVSPSKIKVFGDCANQFKYQYVLELPGQQYGALTVLGTVFHYAAEVYELYDNDIDLAVQTFRYYWNHSDELGQKIDWYPPRTSHQTLEDRGVEMLERYHDLSPWKGGELVGTEIRFEVPLGSHQIRGVVDKLFYRPQKRELEIIDFKTGARVPKRLRYNLQFTCYLYATTRPEFWEQVPGWEDFWPQAMTLKRQGQWFHARDAKVFNVGYRDDSDYRRLLLAVDQMEAAIEAGIYPLTIEGEVCGWCPWLEDCGTEVESPNHELADRLQEPDRRRAHAIPS